MSVDLNLDGQFFTWLDCRNYLAGGSLAQFGRLFGGDVVKGTFCYEYFQTFEQAKACTSWPNFEFFNSSLKYPRLDIIDSFYEAFEFIKTKMNMKVPEFLNLMSIPGDCYDVISMMTYHLILTLKKQTFANIVLIRWNSRHGGITTILSNRHVEINVDPSERVFSIEVYTVPNGDIIRF